MIGRYRKKPLEVEAIQYDGMNEAELILFLKKFASDTSITFTRALSGDSRATINFQWVRQLISTMVTGWCMGLMAQSIL